MKMDNIIEDGAYPGADSTHDDIPIMVDKSEEMVFQIVVYRDRSGVHVFDRDGNKINEGLPRMEEALDYIADMIREYKRI